MLAWIPHALSLGPICGFSTLEYTMCKVLTVVFFEMLYKLKMACTTVQRNVMGHKMVLPCHKGEINLHPTLV